MIHAVNEQGRTVCGMNGQIGARVTCPDCLNPKGSHNPFFTPDENVVHGNFVRVGSFLAYHLNALHDSLNLSSFDPVIAAAVDARRKEVLGLRKQLTDLGVKAQMSAISVEDARLLVNYVIWGFDHANPGILEKLSAVRVGDELVGQKK